MTSRESSSLHSPSSCPSCSSAYFLPPSQSGGTAVWRARRKETLQPKNHFVYTSRRTRLTSGVGVVSVRIRYALTWSLLPGTMLCRPAGCQCWLPPQPFCDASHKGTRWQPVKIQLEEEEPEAWLCGCKQTDTPPYCDGTHATPAVQG